MINPSPKQGDKGADMPEAYRVVKEPSGNHGQVSRCGGEGGKEGREVLHDLVSLVVRQQV